MRIGYLTGEYPKATDTFIQREVAGLRGLGVDVHTFSVRPPSMDEMIGPEQEAERNGTYYILPAHPQRLLASHVSLLRKTPRQYLQTIRLAWSTRYFGVRAAMYQLFYFAEAGVLAWEIKKRGICHLHNHFGSSSCTVAMLAAHLAGITFSFTLHGPHTFLDPFRWHLNEKISRALFVCCISHFCKSHAMLFSRPEKWRKLHIVHCGVEPDLYERVEHNSGSARLLYVGRLATEKGLLVLLQSLSVLRAHYPNLALTIVGDGPERETLEATVSRTSLRNHVEFLGYQSRTEVRAHLQGADVFVLPSFAEGVPVSLMEAMASAVPVVATNVGGVSELVENGISGYVVAPGDPESLTHRIGTLLASKALRAQMGMAGREKVELQFTLEKVVLRLHRIMVNALTGRDRDSRCANMTESRK